MSGYVEGIKEERVEEREPFIRANKSSLLLSSSYVDPSVIGEGSGA